MLTNKNEPIVVNLFGGPGCGKSTLAADIFVNCKKKKINCELVTEYAKDKVWEGNYFTLENQLYIFAKQHHRMFRLKDKVDVIITDSPLLFSLVYGGFPKGSPFYELVLQEYRRYNNINYYLPRMVTYQSTGRSQTEEEAKRIDITVHNELVINDIKFQEYLKDFDMFEIVEYIEKQIKK